MLLVWALGPQVQTSRVPPSIRSYSWVPHSFGRFSHSASCGKFPSSHPRGLGRTPTLASYSAVSLTRCMPSISTPININRPIACPPLWLPNKKRLSYSWLILHLCPGPPFSSFLLEMDIVLFVSLSLNMCFQECPLSVASFLSLPSCVCFWKAACWDRSLHSGISQNSIQICL